MKDYAIEFEKIIAAEGFARLVPGTITANTQEAAALETTSRRAAVVIKRGGKTDTATLPHIEFQFIKSTFVQAYAFTDADRDGYIGVFTGMVFAIYDLFFRMLSHPGVLPWIGQASAESIQEFHLHGALSDYGKLLSLRSPNLRGLTHVRPKDPARAQYAEYLAETALDFFLIHELGHIRHGHCDYIHPNPRPFIREATSRQPNALIGMTLQALELDADAFAAIQSFRECHGKADHTKRLVRCIHEVEARKALGMPVSNVLNANEFFSFDWCFAVCSMFWMLGLDVDISNVETLDHPPPPLRVTMAMATVCEFLRNDAKFLSEFEVGI